MPIQLETGGDELGLIFPTEKPVVLKLKYIAKVQNRLRSAVFD